MSTVTTTKRIDLARLSTEAGAQLSMTVVGAQSTITADSLTTTALQAAVDAHTEPTDPAIAATNETGIRDKATAALDANKTFLAIASPTSAQIAAQVKALTRQNNALIRLALRRFDAAD